jgi:gamma-glutamyl:cysteine ligase YbdK (ATP-grasp superfamily)
MGEEIQSESFYQKDFEKFQIKLKEENALLKNWFDQDIFSKKTNVGGLELEAWIVDKDGNPQAENLNLLKQINDELVVPELSSFNIEFNAPHHSLAADALSSMEESLQHNWTHATKISADMGLNLVAIGILPTIKDELLNTHNMTPLHRYKVLNDQVLRLRKQRPIHLDIQGCEHLQSEHSDVMLESAATAFQIHLQTSHNDCITLFNLSKIIAAPLVAIGANSPYLFGKNLWAETRIPLFEQSVSTGGKALSQRVSFGLNYIKDSMYDVFSSNIDRFPVIIPMGFDDPPEKMHHLKLHNGTIWRWVRPLLGNDEDGTPHLRIEQRVLPAGPSIVDMVANMAFYYGLVHYFLKHESNLTEDIPFNVAKNNFYTAAKEGIHSKLLWNDGKKYAVTSLVLDNLLSKSEQGLNELQISDKDIKYYLENIEKRMEKRTNGAEWQRQFVESRNATMNELCLHYIEQQNSGAPVHLWEI